MGAGCSITHDAKISSQLPLNKTDVNTAQPKKTELHGKPPVYCLYTAML